MKLSVWIEEKGVSLAYVAHKIDASPSTVFKWLAGDFKPSKHLMKNLSKLTQGKVTLKDFEVI